MDAPDAGRFTIPGHALVAGFNSKSAFYALFNKFMKMTQRENRRRAEPARRREALTGGK